ncbi:MAG TPA: hypothetical protein VFZ65_13085 [Planctomycetota bacterium]|nr:hypothetical protein [Planctomycetota bacterium]
MCRLYTLGRTRSTACPRRGRATATRWSIRAATDEGGQCIVYGLGGRDDLVLVVRKDTEVLQRVAGVSFGPGSGSRQVVLDEK